MNSDWNEVQGNYSKESGKIRIVIHPTGNTYHVRLNTLRYPELDLALPEDFKTNHRHVGSLEQAMAIGNKMITDIQAMGIA